MTPCGQIRSSQQHASPAAAVLDNVVFTSLMGPHDRLAQRHGRAVRYPVDISGFAALPDRHSSETGTISPGLSALLRGWRWWNPTRSRRKAGLRFPASPSSKWSTTGWTPGRMPRRCALRQRDVPEILDLVARTEPGPFAPRTIEMGIYLGFRQSGQLIAMAGQRFRPPGWTEISAVCTAPVSAAADWQHASCLRLPTKSGERGEAPFLHVVPSNTKAIAL